MSCCEPPADFLCPITNEVMEDPLMTRAGMSFERHAIIEWIGNHNNTCPMTRTKLSPSDLVPNSALRMKIETWKELNGDSSSDSESSSTDSDSPDVFATFKLSDAERALRKSNKKNRRSRMFARRGSDER